jgi:hypothetical protein
VIGNVSPKCYGRISSFNLLHLIRNRLARFLLHFRIKKLGWITLPLAQVGKAASSSEQRTMLAAKVEQLTAEVAAWAARLGGRRELWAAWLAWRRGMHNRARDRRRAVMQLTAMVRRTRESPDIVQ